MIAKILFVIVIFTAFLIYWLDIRPQQKMEKCIEASIKTHNMVWNRYCSQLGLEDGCELPSDKAQILYMINENDADTCIALYGNKS